MKDEESSSRGNTPAECLWFGSMTFVANEERVSRGRVFADLLCMGISKHPGALEKTTNTILQVWHIISCARILASNSLLLMGLAM